MIILDASFLIAFFNDRDENHLKATRIIRDVAEKKFGDVLITDYVFNEAVTVALMRMKDLAKSTWVGNYLLKSLKLIRIEEDIFLDAWKIFQSQKGRRLGFTDCSTLAAMGHNGIANIATFDEHFARIKGINCIGL